MGQKNCIQKFYTENEKIDPKLILMHRKFHLKKHLGQMGKIQSQNHGIFLDKNFDLMKIYFVENFLTTVKLFQVDPTAIRLRQQLLVLRKLGH